MSICSIILTGGQSRRMGKPKFSLPFGRETLLQRRVRQLQSVFSPQIVMHAKDQTLPLLDDIVLVQDPIPEQGPLLGVMAGLYKGCDYSKWAFVTGCDMPFVNRNFWDLLLACQGDGVDMIIPEVEGQLYPLCALYRTKLWQNAEILLAQEQRRLLGLVDVCRVKRLDERSLRKIDPNLRFLLNINTPQAYQNALRDFDA